MASGRFSLAITAAVTEFGDGITLERDTQDNIAHERSEKAEDAGINKLAFVSEGIKARAVSANFRRVPGDQRLQFHDRRTGPGRA